MAANLSSSHPFLADPLRNPMERFVSAYTGRPWQIDRIQDLRDLACHPAAILSDGSFSVFAKFSDAANGREQFEVELAGLSLLQERAGVLIPAPLGILRVEGGALLVLEVVQAVERQPRHWRDIGRALACIHQVKGEWCGLESNGYFGPLYQDNRPMSNWADFFVERRLWPRLAGAINSGHLPGAVISQMEKLIQRVPDLCGSESKPCLLHGDAQQNNFISTQAGAVVIDPAAHFGHPEFALAYLDYFQPVPEDVFAGYREVLPIAPDFAERRDLWRIYGYLGATEVEGGPYLELLIQAIQKYV